MNTTIRFLIDPFRRVVTTRDPNAAFDDAMTPGERLADRVAAIGGSWGFIGSFCLFLVGWAVLNTIVLGTGAFDPFPFIFFDLMLSMLAALQAPIILMRQNRLETRLDYATNLRAETGINRLPEEVAAIRAEPACREPMRQSA